MFNYLIEYDKQYKTNLQVTRKTVQLNAKKLFPEKFTNNKNKKTYYNFNEAQQIISKITKNKIKYINQIEFENFTKQTIQTRKEKEAKAILNLDEDYFQQQLDIAESREEKQLEKEIQITKNEMLIEAIALNMGITFNTEKYKKYKKEFNNLLFQANPDSEEDTEEIIEFKKQLDNPTNFITKK